MKTNLFAKIGLLIFVLFLASCGISNGGPNLTEAKGFTLSDISGNSVNMGEIIGKKIVLLNFFATWCPPCNAEVPALKELFNEYKNKAAVYAISVGESRAKVSSFVSKKGINYPVLLDEKNSAAGLYSIAGIPTIVVIGLDKKIVYYGHNLEEGRAALGKLIK